jgi:hypothetical protein
MNDEISLGELVILILRFLKKNIILLITFLIIGLILGYVKERQVAPKFKSEAIFCSDMIESERLSEIISDFETATINGNYKYISDVLGIPFDSASNLVGIKIEVIEPEKKSHSVSNFKSAIGYQCIKVTCISTSSMIFTDLENVLLNYLTNHKESKAIVDNRKSEYLKNIAKIEEDMVFLKNQRIKTFEKLLQSKESVDINQFDNEGQFIYAYEKISNLKELYLRSKVAVLLKPFNKMTVASHSKTKGIILTGLMFFSIAMLIAIYRGIKL